MTPQKLSDKLDGLFPNLTLTPDTPAALMTLNELPVLRSLTTYNDPVTESPDRPALGALLLARQVVHGLAGEPDQHHGCGG